MFYKQNLLRSSFAQISILASFSLYNKHRTVWYVKQQYNIIIITDTNNNNNVEVCILMLQVVGGGYFILF